MTRQEIAKIKAKFIEQKDIQLEKLTDAASRELLDAIYEEFFKVLGQQEGVIETDAGKTIRLSTAINRIFAKFNNNQNADIVKKIVSNIQNIVTLNVQYFSLFQSNQQRFKKITDDTNALMKARLGLDDNGSFVKGGYLDRLLSDDTLKNAVLDATRKAVANQWDVRDYLKEIKKIVVGDSTAAGGLTHHYRTFAHDTYSQFDSEYANRVAIQLNLNAAVYEGGLIETSRRFCIDKDGKVFTRQEIEQWKNDPNLLIAKGEKRPPVDYDPFRDKGRWNCRHYFNWIDNATAIQMRPELKEVFARQNAKAGSTQEQTNASKETTQSEAGNENLVNVFTDIKKAVQEAVDKAGNLTSEQRQAVNAYTGTTYGLINGALRNKSENIDKWLSENIDNISNALEQLPIFKGTTYRGIVFKDNAAVQQFAKDYLEAGIFTDLGFLSSTYDERNVFNTKNSPTILFNLIGKSGRPIQMLSRVSTEREVLFPKGTTWKVLEIIEQYKDNGKITLTVTAEEL